MWSPIKKDDNLYILRHKARKPYFIFLSKKLLYLKMVNLINALNPEIGCSFE